MDSTRSYEIIDISGHKVSLIDGTASGGIGQLGPYAVEWKDPNMLEVAGVNGYYSEGYGAVTWVVRHDRKTGHTRWDRAGQDD